MVRRKRLRRGQTLVDHAPLGHQRAPLSALDRWHRQRSSRSPWPHSISNRSPCQPRKDRSGTRQGQPDGFVPPPRLDLLRIAVLLRFPTQCPLNRRPPASIHLLGFLAVHAQSFQAEGREGEGAPPACSGDPLRLASSLWKTGGQIPRGPQAPPPAARGPLGSPDQPAALAKHDQDFKSTSISFDHRMTQQGALSTGKGGKRRAAEGSADGSIWRSVPPHFCPIFTLDTHGRCAGNSTRVQGYGVRGGEVGPRRGLPRIRRARHLDRRAAPKSKFLSYFLTSQHKIVRLFAPVYGSFERLTTIRRPI